MDPRCHDSGDHLGAQWPGLLVGWVVDLSTGRPLTGQCRSSASGRVSWISMADGLRLGFGDHIARLRAVQCVEFQSQSSVYLHPRVPLRLWRRDRPPRVHRVVASVARSRPHVASVLEVFGDRPELRGRSRLADGSLPAGTPVWRRYSSFSRRPHAMAALDAGHQRGGRVPGRHGAALGWHATAPVDRPQPHQRGPRGLWSVPLSIQWSAVPEPDVAGHPRILVGAAAQECGSALGSATIRWRSACVALGVGGLDRRWGGGGEQSRWRLGLGGAVDGGVRSDDAVVEAPSRVQAGRGGGHGRGLGRRRMVGWRGDDGPVPVRGFGPHEWPKADLCGHSSDGAGFRGLRVRG